MQRIEMPQGTSYLQAKRYAGNIMSTDTSASSVRVLVFKETKNEPIRFAIEITNFPKHTVGQLVKL